MSNKLKQSIAIQRQLPEHIRENYPAFVEFIKSYYDFLQETQAQNLEEIRDIDTTLEEFIDRFKSELAKNIPIELSGDKRFLLKHLREFYLSRGSEASFKFLFRALFEKEATLFYPSTQVLRVSDGKWKQDVSIFVKATGTTQNLFALDGKFITITTSKKTITTFVENVLEYSSTTFEVFIQKDYANEIEVGSTVSVSVGTTTYTGTIVKCPSKISVYKAGKGFKVGSLYALQTSLGRGCVVKITKVDSNGGIRGVQVIRFGLDYETTFYSYLSSKTITASEYVHPIDLAEGVMDPFTPAIAPTYTPGDPAYNERSGGFIDYGFMNKQTYFYYDDTIPVGSADRASDRFFADSSYVGEVVQQFYTDQTENIIDEDLAIIKVELGAVAKYPGYYLKADGFISDEMYIHDGEYYQAFSYVIKVEEELRRYADIVKALVHPAGMKAYAEYNIFREIKVSAITPLLSRVLQLPISDRPPSTIIVDDRGYGLDILGNPVYSKQGKASIFSEKNINQILNDIADLNAKHAQKPLSDDYTALSLQYKHFYKQTEDTIQESIDNVIKAYSKNPEHIAFTEDSRQKLVETLKQDSQALSDSLSKLFDKTIEDSLTSHIDSQIKLFQKNLNSDVNESDALQKLVETLKQDFQILSDALSNELSKSITDYSGNFLDYIEILRTQLTEDVLLALDSCLKNLEKIFVDTFSLQDSSSNTLERSNADTINISTNGRVVLAPYDAENYFALFEDYQQAITIS